MPVSPARAAACDILLRVERESSYASELLHSAAYQSLSTADHALATELVMGVLRWRSRLDEELSSASSQPLPKLDLEILIALRLALYQFRWLDRVPARAALHESVELVKRARKRSAAPFVNAVLRKLSASPRDRRTSEDENSSADALVRAFAHPLWLVERWVKEYGLSTAQAICRHDQSIPATTIRLRDPKAEHQLSQENISLLPGGILASARRVQAGDITRTKAFRSGQVAIQDEASQLVAALIGSTQKQNLRVLDCCAAPGGKTLAIADRNPNSSVTAVELYPHRARLLQKLLRLRESAAHIHVVVADARQLPVSQAFDRILAFIIFSAVVFLALTAATLFRTITPVDSWWFPLAPIVFIAGSGLLALMLLLHALGPSLLGAAVVLAGLPVRWLLVRKTNLTRAVAAESS